MRITDGTILLSQPVAGRHQLEGPATIGTTWLDYSMPQDGSVGVALAGCRLLIPITNVIAVVIPEDGEEPYRAPAP